MPRRPSARSRFAFVLVAALLAACDGSPTGGTGATEDLDAVAASLGAAADTMRGGADSAMAPVVAAAAEAIRLADTVGVVSLTYADTTLEWNAVSQRWTLAPGTGARCAPPDASRPIAPGDSLSVPPRACGLLLAPVLVLWRDAGARVLLVHGPVGTATLGRSATLAADSTSARPAYAVLLERANPTPLRGIAVAGSVTVGAPRTTGACAGTPRLPDDATATCVRAASEASFSMTLAVMAPRPTTGDGSVRQPPLYAGAALGTSEVPGIAVRLDPGPRRTVVVPDLPDSVTLPPLVAALTARRDSASGDVVFRFMVRNTTSDTLRLVFPTSRRFGVTVRAAFDSATVWDSSTLGETPVADTVHLAPDASRGWEERWTGGKPGGTFAAGAVLAALELQPRAGTLFALP